MSDLDLMPRIKAAIEDAVIRRSMAEYEWPGCHKPKCRQYHGDILRSERIHAAGWILVRVTAKDRPGVVLQRVRAAIARRA